MTLGDTEKRENLIAQAVKAKIRPTTAATACTRSKKKPENERGGAAGCLVDWDCRSARRMQSTVKALAGEVRPAEPNREKKKQKKKDRVNVKKLKGERGKGT